MESSVSQTEVSGMVEEMLASGTVRASVSVFAHHHGM
jgi:hypothetical protein